MRINLWECLFVLGWPFETDRTFTSDNSHYSRVSSSQPLQSPQLRIPPAIFDVPSKFARFTYVANTSGSLTSCLQVPAGFPLHVVGMLRLMFLTVSQPSLPTPFCSLLVTVSVFMALSTLFHSINSPDSSPLSHSVLPVSFLPYWSFQLHISLWKSPSAVIWSFVVDWA